MANSNRKCIGKGKTYTSGNQGNYCGKAADRRNDWQYSGVEQVLSNADNACKECLKVIIKQLSEGL